MLLVSLSAYLRLSHSGIGCLDWPACYGRIGEAPAATQPVAAGKPVQSGTTQADKYGLVTIDGLKLTKGKHRIAIKAGD